MGQALYRKHRPKSLQDVVGQEHITDTLSQALKSGRISHAYLFSGPRGVGKTSIARILAHEINGFPYDDDTTHLDIIEIDAASNRRIDEIRELRDKIYVAPTIGTYKVYIIDEVHMLTREAFNALLKTLEEPPSHVVFILATTEAHKLPETIVSRTQHYTFKSVDSDKVIGHLRQIADSEGVAIDDEALALLAAHGGGSFRDSISVLDQAQGLSGQTNDTITAAAVQQLLGIAPETAIDALLTSLQKTGQTGSLLSQLGELYDQGLQAASIAGQLSERLRNGLVLTKSVLPVGQTLELLKQLIEVPASHNPERLLEICLLQSSQQSASTNADAPVVTLTAVVPDPPATIKTSPPTAVKPAAVAPKKAAQPVAASIKAVPPVTIPSPAVAAVGLDAAIWPQLLDNIKKQYNTIYGVLRMATPIFTDDGIELQFKFSFHQKRINEVKNKQIIADFIKQMTGSEIAIICTYQKPGIGPTEVGNDEAGTAGVSSLDAINNIFGGAEVLD